MSPGTGNVFFICILLSMLTPLCQSVTQAVLVLSAPDYSTFAICTRFVPPIIAVLFACKKIRALTMYLGSVLLSAHEGERRA